MPNISVCGSCGLIRDPQGPATILIPVVHHLKLYLAVAVSVAARSSVAIETA